jgi:CO/xanthine dehydrogenase Mo-binding subunit
MSTDRYYKNLDECYSEDMLYGASLPSPVANARITSIKMPAELPEEVTFCSAKDIPGSAKVDVAGEGIPLLAGTTVAYEYQPVLLISCPSENRLVRLLKQTQIAYQQEPPLPGIDAFEENQIYRREVFSRGNVEKGLSDAFQIVEAEYSLRLKDDFAKDPLGAFVIPDAEGFTVYCTTQHPFHVRSAVAGILGLDEDAVSVRALDISPSFETKMWEPSVLAAHTALLAWKARRPVRMVDISRSRSDDNYQKNKVKIRLRSGITEKGVLSALRVDIDVDGGAFPLFSREYLHRLLFGSLGIYACGAWEVEIRIIRTNNPPTVLTPGCGLSEGFFALETHVNRLAELSGTPPQEWRKNHLITKKSRSFTKHLYLDTSRIEECIDRVTAISDLRRKHAAYEMSKKRRSGLEDSPVPLRGIGLTSGYQGNGLSGNGEIDRTHTVAVRLEEESTAVLKSSLVTGDTDIHELWRSLAAGILELKSSDIRFEPSDTNRVPDSGPSIFSRNVTLITGVLIRACEAIQQKRFRSPLPIEVKRNITLPKTGRWNPESLTGTPFPSTSLGSAVVEIEMDSVTLETEIKGIWTAVYAGGLYSRQAAYKTVEAGIYHALEWATSEQLWLKDQHRSAQIYRTPHIFTVPDLTIEFLEPDKKAPALGLDTLPFNLIPAAYFSALAQATGYSFDVLPVKPESIQRTLRALEA